MIRKEKGDRQDFREIRAVGFTGDTVGRVKRQATAPGGLLQLRPRARFRTRSCESWGLEVQHGGGS